MLKNPKSKYGPLKTVDLPDRQWPDKVVDKAPIWCSVDLRDGNQALAIPMNIDDKLELFETLVKIGFKEIEVGFPAASETEYAFVRRLIENKLIPDDVVIQVLVQAREHLIRRTFEAIQGARKVIVHLYNSINPMQRRVTFGLEKPAIKQIATDGTRLVKQLVPSVPETKVFFQYSPESFSDTEMDYALEVCEAVMEVWEPDASDKIILNLPATVELATPNVHADQIEWFCRHLKERDKVVISVHTHNDRGTGIAATELAMMAGAERVEGTLFGNGERTGNLDIVTVAMNLYSQGINPGLDFSNIREIRDVYEHCTRMVVHERHPYAGDLVFTSFSGSHQDAIKKGMDMIDQSKGKGWQVPYLLIDPQDIGRTYRAIIRITSQSGKGGVAYIMEREYGLEMPKTMHPEFGEIINDIADTKGGELTPKDVRDAFYKEFIDHDTPLELKSCKFTTSEGDQHSVNCQAKVIWQGKPKVISGVGNGPIAAFVNALHDEGLKDFRLNDFREHSITGGSSAEAAAYIQIERESDKQKFWGVGIDTNIELAGLKALVSAFNRAHQEQSK